MLLIHRVLASVAGLGTLILATQGLPGFYTGLTFGAILATSGVVSVRHWWNESVTKTLKETPQKGSPLAPAPPPPAAGWKPAFSPSPAPKATGPVPVAMGFSLSQMPPPAASPVPQPAMPTSVAMHSPTDDLAPIDWPQIHMPMDHTTPPPSMLRRRSQ